MWEGATAHVSPRGLSATLLTLMIAAIAFAAYYLGVLNPVTQYITQGLDLAGGVRVVLQAQEREDNPITPEAMATTVEVIRRRVDALGVAEPIIQQLGRDRIVVDLAGADPDRALEVIGRTAQLEFIDPFGEVVLTGSNLVSAQAAYGPAGNPIVQLQFDNEGARIFADVTERLVGQPLIIELDDEVITAPMIRTKITGGQAQIEGIPTIEEAQNIAVMLSAGALPVDLEIIENRTVSATLGRLSVEQSQRAAIYSVLLVVAFMMLAYRLPGLMANLALVVYVMLVVGFLALTSATLTLPGMAGIILSIGMAVDANVIIFERIREELRRGRTMRSAIDRGFSNAFSSIVDANLTTIIAAAALYYFGTGPVKGFALTLTVGVLSSMVSALLLTRILLKLLVGIGIVRDPGRMFGVREAMLS